MHMLQNTDDSQLFLLSFISFHIRFELLGEPLILSECGLLIVYNIYNIVNNLCILKKNFTPTYISQVLTVHVCQRNVHVHPHLHHTVHLYVRYKLLFIRKLHGSEWWEVCKGTRTKKQTKKNKKNYSCNVYGQ